MPYSIVLNVFPEGPFDLRDATGARLQAMLLHLIRQADPELAIELHDRPDEDDPAALRHYTVSPIFVVGGDRRVKEIPGSRTVVKAGMPCWLRLAAVDDRVYPALMNYLLGMRVETMRTEPANRAVVQERESSSSQTETPSRPGFSNDRIPTQPARASHSSLPGLSLGSTRFQIVEVLASPASGHPWVGYAGWEELIARASETERQITLQFKSPVVFMQGVLEFPLPVPRLIWRSLYDRWQDAFGDAHPLPGDLIGQVERHVTITRHEIRTRPFRQDSEITLTGFVGQATFRIIGDISPHIVKAVNLLADFALFSGLGKKTTRGMGMIRRIIDRR